MADTITKPIRTFRRGALSVSVWEKIREKDGSKWYSANAQRTYKNAADEWAYTDSFGADDLPTVATLLNIAFHFIVSTEAKNFMEAAK